MFKDEKFGARTAVMYSIRSDGGIGVEGFRRTFFCRTVRGGKKWNSKRVIKFVGLALLIALFCHAL